MNPQADSAFSPARFASGASLQVWEFSDLVLKTRLAQALEAGVARYPIHRSLRFAARQDLQALFDQIALELGWQAQRLGASAMILDGRGLFMVAHGGRKADYCSCFFSIWTESIGGAESGSGGDSSPGRHSSDRRAHVLHRLALPDLEGRVGERQHRGTGQRRAAERGLSGIAGRRRRLHPALSGFAGNRVGAARPAGNRQDPPDSRHPRRDVAAQGGDAQALYTGDKKALESDEIFVKFITGWDDAFVVEDADHLLKPRSEGNENLHRFLAIADGVIRAQGRKIIFSTNLPNVGDLDDALIRPGRCFARIRTAPLSLAQRDALLHKLCEGDPERHAQATARLPVGVCSLAEVYQACRLGG